MKKKNSKIKISARFRIKMGSGKYFQGFFQFSGTTCVFDVYTNSYQNTVKIISCEKQTNAKKKDISTEFIFVSAL